MPYSRDADTVAVRRGGTTSRAESGFFYTPDADAKQLIEHAFKELSGNQLITFVLAIGAGLRRNEIDKLPWTHVDLPAGVGTGAPTNRSGEHTSELQLLRH